MSNLKESDRLRRRKHVVDDVLKCCLRTRSLPTRGVTKLLQNGGMNSHSLTIKSSLTHVFFKGKYKTCFILIHSLSMQRALIPRRDEKCPFVYN